MYPFLNRKNFLTFLAPFGVAIIVALVIDQFFHHVVLARDIELSNTQKVKMLLEETHPEEIPVFGSSKARSAFIPDSLGPNVYNYAMPKCNFATESTIRKPHYLPKAA